MIHPIGIAVVLMSCGMINATGLLCARHWTTGRKTISDIIVRMPYRVKSSPARDGSIVGPVGDSRCRATPLIMNGQTKKGATACAVTPWVRWWAM